MYILYNTYYTSCVSLVYKLSAINAVCRLVSGLQKGVPRLRKGWEALAYTKVN